jgi:hypothetical protein
MEEREAEQREIARRAELARLAAERAHALRRNCGLLLTAFDQLAAGDDFQMRGYGLQDLLNGVLDAYDIPVERSFTRNAGGEQIDGGFVLGSWRFIVECRWRKQLDSIRDIDGLAGQVDRSGKASFGLYLSINGWSKHVEPLFKQASNKSVLLMDGYDLSSVLAEEIDLRAFLEAKINHHSFRAEPFLSVRQFRNDSLVAS